MIEKELAQCRQAAEEGYKIASAAYGKIERTLKDAEERINAASAEQSKISRIKDTELPAKQRAELQKLEADVKGIRDDIENLHERQKDFSVIVFGRTMAGKSTLMEILTNGNGESIGKGAQRTTLDVRSYEWQGLRVIDVPGICAFDEQNKDSGKEEGADDTLAIEAAKTADLILFLLNSNAPDASEAKSLAQLKTFGKPILGLVNVRRGLNINRRAMALRNLQDAMSKTKDIDDVVAQFKERAKGFGQDWSDIKFVKAHLLAAYQAHPARGNDAEIYKLSNFAEVENFILDKVRADGRFLRVKTFVDSVAVPMSNIILKIFEHSGRALQESIIWAKKRHELDEWSEKFQKRVQEKLDRLYAELQQTLNNEINSFAENHYEDEKVGEHWQQHVQRLHFDKRYQSLLRELAGECEPSDVHSRNWLGSAACYRRWKFSFLIGFRR